MCFRYIINLLQKEKASCMIRPTDIYGKHSEICTFVTELDTMSLVNYYSQLSLIYTESISDKSTTSSAT